MSSRDPYFQFAWDSTVHGEVELETDDSALGIRSLSDREDFARKFLVREVAPELSFAWLEVKNAHRSLSSSARWHAPHTLFYFWKHNLLITPAEDMGQNRT
ncbi:hypothetical protein ACLB2K_046326 [Fragaria x ananassa]